MRRVFGAKELDMMETGIILWNDFNMKMVDVLVNSVDIVEKYSSVEQNSSADASGWACPACTFINDDPLVTICAMCGSPKPTLPAVTFESSRGGGETREPDLKRVKKSDGTKEGDSKPKAKKIIQYQILMGFNYIIIMV